MKTKTKTNHKNKNKNKNKKSLKRIMVYYHVRSMSHSDEHACNMDIDSHSGGGNDTDDICDSFAVLLSDEKFGIRVPHASRDGISQLTRVHTLPESEPDSESTSEPESERHIVAVSVHTPVLQQVCESDDSKLGITVGGETCVDNNIVHGLQLPSNAGGVVSTEELGIDVVHQVKLSKSEWDYTEVPENQSEKDIMQMIIHGFNDVNIVRTSQQSLISFLKITPSHEMHQHLYTTFYQNALETLVKKHRKAERDHLTHLARLSGNTEAALVDVFQSWKMPKVLKKSMPCAFKI